MNFIAGQLHRNGTTAFRQEGADLTLPLAPAMAERLKDYGTGPVTLGIRPEHIHMYRPADVPTVAPIKAMIEVVEPVGNEIFVYFSTGSASQFVARFATDHAPEVGKQCELLVDTTRIHLFDHSTERTL